MTQSIQPLSLIFDLNGRLFFNALEGVTEELATQRVSEHNNPINWIAAHTVSSRYLMLLVLGKPVADPYETLFANFKGYDSSLNYPKLSDVKAEWEKVTSLLKEALGSVSEDHITGDTLVKTPIGDFSNGGTLAFMAQHESYDIGQMGFLKKYNTKEAMKY